MDHALLMGERQRRRDVARQAQDVVFGERAFARDPRPQAVGAQIHREIDVLPGLRDRADPDDVGMLELRGRLTLIAKPGLELRVARVAGLQHLDGDGRSVGCTAYEGPRESTLAEQAFEDVRAEGMADEVGGSVGHGSTLQRGRSRLTYGALND